MMFTEKTKMSLAVLATVVLLSACKNETKTPEKVQYVKTETVQNTNKANSLTFPGKTKSADDINVAFRVSGTLSKVYVKAGDHVTKGQLIAAMDSRDYQVQYNATKAEYESIKADAERIIAMYEEGNTTASNYDKARYGLEQISQKLNNHRNQLDDTRLYSPIDGYVQDILHEGGETVSAGMPIIAMFGSGALEIEVNVSAFDYANRERLNTIFCKFDLFEEEFPLKIQSISPEANASQMYTARLRFTDAYDRKKITPGMTTMVYVTYDTDSLNNNMRISSSALFEKSGQHQVFVYDAKSSTVKARNVIVKALHRDGTAEVTDGLKEGETIITAGVHHITEGQKVMPLPKNSKSNVGGLL